jgi:hypothetical protein
VNYKKVNVKQKIKSNLLNIFSVIAIVIALLALIYQMNNDWERSKKHLIWNYSLSLDP